MELVCDPLKDQTELSYSKFIVADVSLNPECSNKVIALLDYLDLVPITCNWF